MEKSEKKQTGKKFGGFFVLGVFTTLVELAIYTLVARIIGDNDYLWIATLIGGVLGTIIAFILNSKIIWKNNEAGKREALIFFVYNIVKTLTLKEFLTWAFSFLTPVYEFAFSICQFLHLPFDYDFVESTGIFGFTALVCMMITYLVYDKIVFLEKKNEKGGKKKNMESVRKPREEEEGNNKGTKNAEE